MARATKSPAQRVHRTVMESAKRSSLNAELEKILSRLADLLIRNGYGSAQFSRLARTAFVEAAQLVGKKKNRAASVARTAAVTGLTRPEVSRILRSVRSRPKEFENDSNRAERVARGWMSDRQFLQKNNRPLTLRYAGSSASFTNLVKKYGGDIPVRAMLN